MTNEIVKRDKPAQLVKMLERSFASALPTHVTKEHFARALLTEFRRVPKLAQCTQSSLGAGVLTFAQLGLMIGVNGAGWLIPFKNKSDDLEATVVIGYQGLIDLCYRSGMVESIFADVVYANDDFTYEQGLEQKLRHVPKLDGSRGEPYCAYAIARIKDSNTPVFVVLSKDEIENVKRSSPGAKSSQSPWQGDFEGEMWKKTAIRRLAKLLPKSIELHNALDIESKQAEHYREVSAEIVEEPTEAKKLVEKVRRGRKLGRPKKKPEPEQSPEQVIQDDSQQQEQSASVPSDEEMMEAYKYFERSYEEFDVQIDAILKKHNLPDLPSFDMDACDATDRVNFVKAYKEFKE